MTREEAKQLISDIDKAYRNFTADEYKALDMAIKALSQEPCRYWQNGKCNGNTGVCDDAISREAVINMLDGMIKDRQVYFGHNGDIEYSCGFSTFKFYVQQLPSVTQKSGKWIPVSEGLPEEGTYLVTVERIDGKPRTDINSFAKDLNKVDEFDFPKHKCGWYNYDSEYGYWEDTKVIAWMPLPEPYEPQESEE